MYLRGSKWSMNKRRKPWNWFRIVILGVLVSSAVYVNQFIVPTVQPIGIPTATATRDPESFISEAEEFFKQGKLNQAIEAYTQVVRGRPKDSASYVAMARVQVWAGKYIEAQTSAENAILINPSNSNAHAVRGWALDFQKDFVASSISIKKALEIDPNNALAHAYYAELLMDQSAANTGPLDALQKASEESQRALALDPSLLEAHRARGYVYYMTSNETEAIAEYQAAIAINKNLEDLQLSLGLSYRAAEAYDEATDAFTQANTLNPSDALPNLYISRIQATLGNYARALQYAESAVNAEPANANYHGNMGVMLYRNFKYSEAIDEFNLVVKGGKLKDGVTVEPMELTPDSPRAAEYYFIYGMSLTKTDPQRCGDAVQLALQILDKLRNNPDYVFNANEIIRICTEATAEPAETPGTSSAEKTPTVTPTP
jgi:tetratricopeptide (TPR) repeat protein